MTEQDKLLPCPFCGAKAEILPYRIPGYEKAKGMYPCLLVRCRECPARMVVTTKYKSQARVTWNGRTPATGAPSP